MPPCDFNLCACDMYCACIHVVTKSHSYVTEDSQCVGNSSFNLMPSTIFYPLSFELVSCRYMYTF